MKLKTEAINEIVDILKEVQEVQSLMTEFGINYNSDTWRATNISIDYNDNEDILNWEKKDFEVLNSKNIINKGDVFYIGGCVYTGSEHEYKNKWIVAPKQLARVQGDIVTRYFKSIINSYNPKYFTLEFENPNGLIDNCGWEEYIGINAIVKQNALKNDDTKTKELLKQIGQEEDNIIELSASPIYKNPTNDFFSKESGLQPKGKFAYMVEFFSLHLIDPNDDNYKGCFSEYDYNGKYIRDAMNLINTIEVRANELENKYCDKGVKVTINDFNEGCQYGMAIYVWIPYQ